MSTTGVGAISIFLLIVAWRRWLECTELDGHAVQQGVLLVVITVAWFLWIVWGWEV